LNWLVGTLPVTARNGTESKNALPSAIGRLAEPGPQDVKVARRPAGHPIIDIGHEAGDRLVMHRQGLDVVGSLIERIDELNIAVAAQAEDLRHLLANEISTMT